MRELPAANDQEFLVEAGGEPSAVDIAKTLYKIPALLTMRTRCGKAGCRCTRGHLHGPYYVLHWREGTIQRRRYVKADDVPAIRSILAGRHAARNLERSEHALALRAWRHLRREVLAIEARHREWMEDL